MKNRWFDSFLNVGVTPDLDAFDANCIRAMNRFGFYGTIASCIGISYGFFLEDTVYFFCCNNRKTFGKVKSNLVTKNGDCTRSCSVFFFCPVF